jgi:hypothetical protein
VNHLIVKRRRAECEPAEGIKKADRKRLLRESVIEFVDAIGSVSGSIQVEATDDWRHVCMPNAFKNKKERSTVMRWITGGVARHQKCKSCGDGTEVSREHALECSNATQYLRSVYGHFEDEDAEMPLINQLLNRFRLNPPDDDFYKHLAHAVSLIYTKCLGFKQKRTGFWVKDDDRVENAPPNQNEPNVQLYRPLAVNPNLTERRRRQAIERNRPVGRPRSGQG